MKRCLGFVLVVVSGVSDGTSISLSLRTVPVLGKVEIVDATSEVELVAQQHQSAMTQHDIEGIENILGAFAQMIGSFAMAMANAESPTIAATSITNIVTNACKVIVELVKHKGMILESGDCDFYAVRGNNAPYTVELMERELLVTQDENAMPMGNPKAQVILSNFASILDNCANIAGDPHNPKVVGSNLAGLFARIIDIAIVAKRHGLVTLTTTPEELNNYLLHDEEMMDALRDTMRYKATRAHLLRLSAGWQHAEA